MQKNNSDLSFHDRKIGTREYGSGGKKNSAGAAEERADSRADESRKKNSSLAGGENKDELNGLLDGDGEEGINIPDLSLGLRGFVEKMSPANNNLKLAGLALMVVATAYIFTAILSTEFSAMAKAVGSGILFYLSGEIIRAWMGWGGFWGLIMFRDKRVLGWIDRQAHKYKNIWNVLADISLVMGYGLLSWFLIGKEQRKAKNIAVMYGAGIPLLLIFSSLLMPYALPMISAMVSGGDLQTASVQLRQSVQDTGGFAVDVGGEKATITYIGILMFAALVAGGLATSVMLSLFIYALMILPQVGAKLVSIIASFLFGSTDSAVAPSPGGAPILPGINLPLVEGILALASVLIVHEMSHGFLARIANIRLDSAGIVFFGILPFGAFVELDEKQMEKEEKYKANRIMVAGSGANLILAMLSFALLTAIVASTADLRLEGYKVISGPLPHGAIVQSIGGVEYTGQNVSLEANSTVVIGTSLGEFEKQTDENGKIGIQMALVDKKGSRFVYQYSAGFEWIEFILNTLGLMFAINLFVGIINLLPIPLFDGNRLMANGIGSMKVATIISAVASGAFVANMLPWIFK